MIDPEHPAIVAYMTRLGAAAAALPPGRREELVGEIRGHLTDALGATTGAAADDAAVAAALDRLGTPEEIVAAESTTGAVLAGGTTVAAPPPGPPRAWGALEITTVIGLIAGTFVLPVIGPVTGLVCAWLSPRWSASDKAIATALALLPVIVLAIGAAALGLLRVTGTTAAGVAS